ncbi:hypothetical protein D5S18_04320 [Nocardia panacis]|uniref:Uncharacterized protein n=1 Tax=Nocardia panacis TaxID=2340916 RepID=A0A3A4KRM2_9NOCA|nr:hypothetical protein D5S18_04320 [Nocardia panacis]
MVVDGEMAMMYWLVVHDAVTEQHHRLQVFAQDFARAAVVRECSMQYGNPQVAVVASAQQ